MGKGGGSRRKKPQPGPRVFAVNNGKEHITNARPSTEEEHEKGKARKQTDKGGEKKDARREY
jgi:hypothetical protein